MLKQFLHIHSYNSTEEYFQYKPITSQCAIVFNRTIYLIYSFSRDFAVWHVSRAKVLLKMQCDVSCAKRAHVLSRNEIQEMDLDSDKCITQHKSQRQWEACPPSWQSSISKSANVADYNCHMGHVDNADWMANSYTASHQTWKWTKKSSFPICWTWPLSTVTSFYHHAVGRKSHTIFNSPLSERCWCGLSMSYNHPCL
jgi:hypothetical protein